MSRSKKKTKIQAVSNAETEKEDKRDANRKLRRKVKQQVKSGKETLAEKKEVSNVWSFNKDGKHYNPEIDEKKMRK
jgi:hypothetical protein